MLNDRFIKLLTKELSNELTQEEQDELRLLLKDNEEYLNQRNILKDYWEQNSVDYAANAAMFKKVLDKIKAISGTDEFDPYPYTAGETSPKRISSISWYSAAAIILAFLGFLTLRTTETKYRQNNVGTVKWMQKTTKPAARAIITLADGTVVTLNAATTFRFPENFAGKNREVYLDGEAYFDVHKDHQHPFIIHTNKMNVRVLGTSFNVKSYKNQQISETTLIRGSIEVTLNDRPSDRIILKPKEKLIVQNNIPSKKSIKVAGQSAQAGIDKGTLYSLTSLTYYNNNDKTIVETSWTQNKLVFSNKDFSDLSPLFENWYGVHIQFANDRVKAYRFTALFEKETLTEALDALKMTEPFNYKISDSTVYIY